MSYKILVCQNKTCKHQGSASVLKAFQQRVDQRRSPSERGAHAPLAQVVPSGCLGQCGRGPMVLLLSEVDLDLAEASADQKIWCDGVRPEDVAAIAQRYLQPNLPTNQATPQPSSKWFWVWWAGAGLFFVVCIIIAVVAAMNSHYV